MPPKQHVNARRLPRVIVAAVIITDGRVLACERSAPPEVAGRWEFPGGKVEAGETPEAALIRELAEELGIAVKADCLAPFVFASHPYEAFHLLMPLFLCRRWDGRPEARHHRALKWVRPGELDRWPMPPADAPLIAYLRDFL